MLFIIGIFVSIGLWYYGRKYNGMTIRDYIESKGGELVSEEYEPFGKGWFGESNESIYKITYRDKKGNLHESWAKTSLFTGVFLSDDTIIEYGNRKERKENELVEENERLKAELAKYKKQHELEEEFMILPDTTQPAPLKKGQVVIEPIHQPKQDVSSQKIVQTFNTDDGEIIIEQTGKDIEVGDKVFLNKKMAPDGRYKLEFLHYIYVREGRIC